MASESSLLLPFIIFHLNIQTSNPQPLLSTSSLLYIVCPGAGLGASAPAALSSLNSEPGTRGLDDQEPSPSESPSTARSAPGQGVQSIFSKDSTQPETKLSKLLFILLSTPRRQDCHGEIPWTDLFCSGPLARPRAGRCHCIRIWLGLDSTGESNGSI